MEQVDPICSCPHYLSLTKLEQDTTYPAINPIVSKYCIYVDNTKYKQIINYFNMILKIGHILAGYINIFKSFVMHMHYAIDYHINN